LSIDPDNGTPTPDEIRAEAARITASADFQASRQMTRFLNYIVDTSLAGHEEQIKERRVAMHALDRDGDFDPRLDPIVRMVAGKLRRALERYYAGEDGARNPLRIEVPKGGYRPAFTRKAAQAIPVSVSQALAQSPLDGRGGTALPVVAIVPFVTFTKGALERLLADSIAQDVCVGLSRFTWFEVIDYLTARSQGLRREAPIDVAFRLHADFCLTGTVRRKGEAFRATVQLTDARVGTVVWACEFDLVAGVEGGSALDRMTQRIVGTIGDIFGVLAAALWRNAQRKPVHQLSACEAVLSNLHYQSQLADGIYSAAFQAAQQALTADPDFAWGWAALATLHLDGFALVAKGGARDASEQALACVRRGLQADPTSAFVHWTLGLYHLMHGQTDEAVGAAELAIEHAQGSPFEMAAAGAVLSAAGDHDRGQALIDCALEINPQLPGWVHWGTAINDLERGEGRRALATTRRFSLPECFWDHLLRAAALSHAGETQQARVAAQRARQLRPELGHRPRKLICMIVQESDVQERILESLEVAGSATG
jgi:adenylate cyclase